MHFQMADFGWEAEPTTDDLIEANRDIDMARKIYEHIMRHGPRGLIIRVEVTTRGGIAMLSHYLMPPTYKYVIHLKDLATEYGWKKVDRAVGLLLELWDLPRNSYNAPKFREIFQERSRDPKNRRLKLGMFKREVDLTTGKSKLILPDFVGAK